MNDINQLADAAYKGERAAARRLVARAGMTEAAALRAVLERVAGAGGLAALLAERAAAHAADAVRAHLRDERHAAAQAAQRVRHDGAPTAWRAWFDGSAHPNPGRCGIGALLTGPAGQRIELARAVGYGGSSEAEYLALIAVLEAALGAQARPLTVYGDSRVVLDDVAGDGAGSVALAPLRASARALLAELREVALRWIPRHKNGAADALSRRGAQLPWSD